MPDFVAWLAGKGYIERDDPDRENIRAEYIFNKFDSRCKKLETIEKAIRQVIKVKK
jgi:hypothetical protein